MAAAMRPREAPAPPPLAASDEGECRAACRRSLAAVISCLSVPSTSTPPTAGLVSLCAQLDSVRAAAAAGDFAAARPGYTAVEAALRKVAAGAGDASAATSWAQFLGALREEQELVAAWESECAELAEWAAETAPQVREGAGGVGWPAAAASPAASPAAAPGSPNPFLTPPLPQILPPHRAAPAQPAAYAVDPRSFGVMEELAPRQLTPATEPPPRDADVWPPADTPPASMQPPGVSARLQSRREREEAYERQRREGATPTTAGRRGAAKPRASTGARRSGGCSGLDPKTAVLDMMLSGYSAADQVSRVLGAAGRGARAEGGREGAQGRAVRRVACPLSSP